MTISSRWARWLATSFLPGTGPVTLQRALEQVRHIDAFFELRPDALRALLPEGSVLALMDYRQKGEDSAVGRQVMRCLERLNAAGDDLMVRDDEDYPPLLAQTHGAPSVLFLRGRRGLLNEPQLAVIGARAASRSGRELAQKFAADLVRAGITVTSGLAIGIDGAAHRGALAAGGPTVAVLGSGLDEIYPACHDSLARQIAAEGLLVTEMPYGTSPSPANFPRRNRIISGLSLGVLVVEAGLKSGSLGTAQHALEQGREVFAVPGPVQHPLARGCHRLLRDGARLVESIEDILPELPPIFEAQRMMGRVTQSEAKAPAAGPRLTDEERRVMSALANAQRNADELVSMTGMPIERLLETLLMLELQGYTESVPGGYRATLSVERMVS